jgi:RNA polymerase sigma-70 factor (ECF subfamily)
LESELISAIKQSDERSIKPIYEGYLDVFVNFLKKYNVATHQATEIFHDSLLAMHKQAISGKLDNVNSSFKTYLFAIGKFKAFNHLKKHKKDKVLELKVDIPENIDLPKSDESINIYQEQLYKHFKKLGNSCQKMLINFYYKQLSIKDIQVLEGYESENTVRSQKSRCLKQLKKMIKDG